MFFFTILCFISLFVSPASKNTSVSLPPILALALRRVHNSLIVFKEPECAVFFAPLPIVFTIDATPPRTDTGLAYERDAHGPPLIPSASNHNCVNNSCQNGTTLPVDSVQVVVGHSLSIIVFGSGAIYGIHHVHHLFTLYVLETFAVVHLMCQWFYAGVCGFAIPMYKRVARWWRWNITLKAVVQAHYLRHLVTFNRTKAEREARPVTYSRVAHFDKDTFEYNQTISQRPRILTEAEDSRRALDKITRTRANRIVKSVRFTAAVNERTIPEIATQSLRNYNKPISQSLPHRKVLGEPLKSSLRSGF